MLRLLLRIKGDWMEKEKFLYELIDNYLYYVNLNSIIMENYTSKESTAKNLNVAIKQLESCLDFYDKMDEAISCGNVEKDVANAKLEYIIMELNARIKNKLISDIRNNCKNYIEDIDCFIREKLYYDDKGKEQRITGKTIKRFIFELRKKEEDFSA